MRKRGTLTVIAVVLGVLLGLVLPQFMAVSSVSAPSGSGDLAGKAFRNDAVKAGIKVCAKGPGDTTTEHCDTTDDAGKYDIVLTAGDYKVTAVRGEKEVLCHLKNPQDKKRRTVTITSGQTEKLNVYC